MKALLLPHNTTLRAALTQTNRLLSPWNSLNHILPFANPSTHCRAIHLPAGYRSSISSRYPNMSVAPSAVPSLVSAKLDADIKPFPSPFLASYDEVSSLDQPPRALLELAMDRLSAAIRSKPNWRIKRLDPAIVSKWRLEAASLDPLLVPSAIQYVLDSLPHYDSLLDQQTGIEMATVDGVWQSDSLLPSELVADIKRAVHTGWGHQTSEQQDWHPGSGRQVWDVVHPSLYCLTAGRTRVVQEDITLESCMGKMGGGRVLSEARYARQLQELTAPIVSGVDPRVRYYNEIMDSDDEADIRAQRAALAEAQKPVRSPEEAAALAKAAWEDGNIKLFVFCTVNSPASYQHRFAVYVKPDALLADLRREVAPQLPKTWRTWSLRRIGQAVLAEDEKQPLYALGLHSSDELEVELQQAEDEKQAAARAERDKRAAAALKPIHITVVTSQRVHISLHRLDQSATVATLLQQLCDGSGKVKAGCYPSFARDVPPSEQRLYTIGNYNPKLPPKRLHPHHTFAQCQLKNGTKVFLAWRRVTPSELAVEANTIELRVQSLRHRTLPATLLDAALDTTVGSLRRRLCGILPGVHVYHALPLAHCHLYFPSTSSSELSDDSQTLSSLGMDQQTEGAVIGARWQGDEKVQPLDVLGEAELTDTGAAVGAADKADSGAAADVVVEAARPAADDLNAEDNAQRSTTQQQQPSEVDSVPETAEKQQAAGHDDCKEQEEEADMTLHISTEPEMRRSVTVTIQQSVHSARVEGAAAEWAGGRQLERSSQRDDARCPSGGAATEGARHAEGHERCTHPLVLWPDVHIRLEPVGPIAVLARVEPSGSRASTSRLNCHHCWQQRRSSHHRAESGAAVGWTAAPRLRNSVAFRRRLSC